MYIGPAATSAGLSFRALSDADFDFIEQLYASTRAEEVAATGWPAEQQHAFLTQQHRAQHQHYQRTYNGAQWLIVMRDGAPIGRLYQVEWPAETRVIDIALVEHVRNRGYGQAILTDIMAAAGSARRAVTLHVDKNSPARRFYARLGFSVAEDKGVHDLLRWMSSTDQ